MTTHPVLIGLALILLALVYLFAHRKRPIHGVGRNSTPLRVKTATAGKPVAAPAARKKVVEVKKSLECDNFGFDD